MEFGSFDRIIVKFNYIGRDFFPPEVRFKKDLRTSVHHVPLPEPFFVTRSHLPNLAADLREQGLICARAFNRNDIEDESLFYTRFLFMPIETARVPPWQTEYEVGLTRLLTEHSWRVRCIDETIEGRRFLRLKCSDPVTNT